MTKGELINEVAARSGVMKGNTGAVLAHLADVFSEELAAGREVVIHGVGKFTVKATNARQGRNPHSGEAISIPAGKKVSFKLHKALKDSLNR
jgi:DNA-binding protein HU-beta